MVRCRLLGSGPRDLARGSMPGNEGVAHFGRVMKWVLISVVVFSARPLAVRAQEGEAVGALRGQVVSIVDSTGVSNALVRLEGLGEATLSDQTGAFAFRRVPPGDVRVSASAYSFEQAETTVTVEGGRTARVTLQLTPQPIESEGLSVTVEGRMPRLARDGFYDRKERGLGVLFGPEYMERAAQGIGGFDPERFLLTHGAWNPFRRAGRKGCEGPVYFVNGRPDRTGLVASGRLSASEVVAVEVYRDQLGAPVWAMTPEVSKCGAIIVWLER